jgi:hypothetical protein
MGFITAVTALSPEVGSASEKRDLIFRRNSITNREYTETYDADAYSIFGLSFNIFQVIYQIKSQ